jgi:predicted ferric reductase
MPLRLTAADLTRTHGRDLGRGQPGGIVRRTLPRTTLVRTNGSAYPPLPRDETVLSSVNTSLHPNPPLAVGFFHGALRAALTAGMTSCYRAGKRTPWRRHVQCCFPMKRALHHGTFWIMLYILVVLFPLALVLLGERPPARGLLVEFAVGLGFVGLAMMGFQFALTARFRSIAGTLGMDNMLQFHRQAGIIAVVFVLAHAVLVIVGDRPYFEYFDPRVNWQRAGALSAVTVLLVTLVVITLWRQQIKLPYEWWRLTHGIIGSFILLVGLAHVMMIEYLVHEPWKKFIIIALVVGSLLLLVQARIVKPLLALRRPWRVAAVRKEIDKIWTITLEAVGHDGLRFRPGQCIWMTIDDSPFALAQHPFTIASSAVKPAGGEPTNTVDLTIKEVGDYTAKIGSVAIGSRAYVEGPYGAATLDLDSDHPAVFIIGGIGITPTISMLRTLRDLNRPRPLLLINANVNENNIVFREELDAMRDQIGLKLVNVLEHPPPGWGGERGYVTKAILMKHLTPPFDRPDTAFFVCGPEPMMNAVEPALRNLGVSIHQINSERFQIV